MSSLIILLFESIYYIFSHEIYSDYMTFAFCCPLLLGFLYQKFFSNKNYVFKKIYNAGIITITAASILEGIVEIAGAYSKYTMPMLFFGIGIVVLCFITHVFQYFKSKTI